MSTFKKTKMTQRFTFGISRNDTAKKAGSNSFSISTNPSGNKYSTGTTNLTMTVKEATALQNFLNSTLTYTYDDSGMSDS